MPSTRIDVKPEILEWVAANAQNLSAHWQQQLNEWVTGDKKPTKKKPKIPDVAKKFGVIYVNLYDVEKTFGLSV